jgi:cysteine-rich repeat protein
MPPVCGDGLVKAPEQCDDRNAKSGDGCETDCKRTAPVCGNADVESGELCDDGPGDKCTATCGFDGAKAAPCAAAIDLGDPNLVTKNGDITTFAGTTVGGPKGFGSASCTQKALAASVRLHRFTAPTRGDYRFETVATLGGIADTVLWAYADCLDTATTTACVDDSGNGKLSSFSVFLPKGVSLYVVVGGLTAGAYTLKVTQNSSCGDGVVGDGELCDDGDDLDGDGCSSKCMPELTVAESEPNDSGAQANVYAPDVLAKVEPTGDADWYSLVVPMGKKRVVAGVFPVFGGTCDPAKTSESQFGAVNAEIALYANDGTTIVKSGDVYTTCPVLVVKNVQPGSYRLKVGANSKFCPKCLFEYGLHADAIE